VGIGFILTGGEVLATAVGGVVVLVGLLILYGPQPASTVMAATAPTVTSNRYIRFITAPLSLYASKHSQEVPR
jgi:hypothetical protein